MQRTGIEYLDFTYNYVKGRCPNTDCPIWSDCYMKRPPSCWAVEKNPKLRLDTKILFQKFPDEPKRIGVGFNLELLHDQIPSAYIEAGLKEIRERGQRHTWLFLTKCPTRYAEFDFPKNCWLGVTVTNLDDNERVEGINGIINLKVGKNNLFVSCEPLLGDLDPRAYDWDLLKWIIVGAMTGTKAKQYQPQKKWVERIVATCKYSRFRDSKIPIFLKDNLAPIWGDKLIREFPEP